MAAVNRSRLFILLSWREFFWVVKAFIVRVQNGCVESCIIVTTLDLRPSLVRTSEPLPYSSNHAALFSVSSFDSLV
jgi:hypothetical protein